VNRYQYQKQYRLKLNKRKARKRLQKMKYDYVEFLNNFQNHNKNREIMQKIENNGFSFTPNSFKGCGKTLMLHSMFTGYRPGKATMLKNLYGLLGVL